MINIPTTPHKRRRRNLTRREVEGLELFDALVEHHGRSRKALLKDVVGVNDDDARTFRGNLRAEIFDACGGRCFYCKREIQDGETWYGDHVVPHARGGRTNRWNGVVACFACNSAKSDKVW